MNPFSLLRYKQCNPQSVVLMVCFLIEPCAARLSAYHMADLLNCMLLIGRLRPDSLSRWAAQSVDSWLYITVFSRMRRM